MTKELSVKGMHCSACASLIKMELEEVGIDSDSISVRVDGLNNKGIVTIANIDDSKAEKAIEIVNSMESYEVE